ncbi:MAG: response regulator transcription factor [Candidatus Kapabacteria bacterium]|jgi:DNA-binding NarL/FixJ family response regulator|nr:response regulator transcription factor [Candidatus Kapabacteria bacterium]
MEARLFIVDDHEVVQHGLAMSLQNYLDEAANPDFTLSVVGAARTGTDALAAIPQSGANTAFVDVMLPDMSGLRLIRTLREQGLSKERLRVLVVTELGSPNVREMFASGANGYISKQEESAVFAEAVRAILDNPSKTWLQPHVAQELVKLEYTLKAYELTPTEIDVIELLELSNPEIAEYLGITVGTVRNHLMNIYGKLNVDSRKDVVAFARRLGLRSLRY